MVTLSNEYREYLGEFLKFTLKEHVGLKLTWTDHEGGMLRVTQERSGDSQGLEFLVWRERDEWAIKNANESPLCQTLSSTDRLDVALLGVAALLHLRCRNRMHGFDMRPGVSILEFVGRVISSSQPASELEAYRQSVGTRIKNAGE